MTVQRARFQASQDPGWVAAVAPLLTGASAVDTSQWRCEFCPFEDGETDCRSRGGQHLRGRFRGQVRRIRWPERRGQLPRARRQREAATREWTVLECRSRRISALTARSVAVSGRPRRGLADRSRLRRLTPQCIRYDAHAIRCRLRSVVDAAVGMGTRRQHAEHDRPRFILAQIRPRNLARALVAGWASRSRVALATELNYTHETRDGQRLLGSSFITTSSQLPAPVDFVTDQLDWSARYETAEGAIGVSYFGSFFSDRRPDFTWSNPFTAIAPGADQGRASLAPDNSFNQVALNFSRRLGEVWYLRMNGSLGRGEQDDSYFRTPPTR